MTDNFFNTIQNEYRELLKSKIFYGEIVDNNDTLYEGRVRVRIPELHGNSTQIPDSIIPFARYKGNGVFGSTNGFSQLSVPKKGILVKVTFPEGVPELPVWEHCALPDESISNELKDDYLDAHIIVLDNEQTLKIIYKKNAGLIFQLQDSFIQIGKDSVITIFHKDSKSIMEFKGGDVKLTTNATYEVTTGDSITENSKSIHINGNETKIGANPIFSGVLGEPLFAFLAAMATAIDAKYPPSPGILAGLANQAKELSLSKTVTISN